VKLVIISYDIQDDRVRTRLAKKLKDFGTRVQKSVFEADINEKELTRLLKLLNSIVLEKDDSIRLYQICAACDQRITIWGVGQVTRDQDYYIV